MIWGSSCNYRNVIRNKPTIYIADNFGRSPVKSTFWSQTPKLGLVPLLPKDLLRSTSGLSKSGGPEPASPPFTTWRERVSKANRVPLPKPRYWRSTADARVMRKETPKKRHGERYRRERACLKRLRCQQRHAGAGAPGSILVSSEPDSCNPRRFAYDR